MPYAVKRRRRYWARFQVPVDVADSFEGKREVWINLNTEDHRQAEARASREASEFRARVLEARGRVGSVEEDALRWRREAKAAGEHSDVIFDKALREAADRFVKGGHRAMERDARLHHDHENDEALKSLGGPKARTFVNILLGRAVPLLPFVAPWLTVRATEIEGRSLLMDDTAIKRFVKSFPLLTDVTRPAVAAWVEERRKEVAANSIQRNMAGIRAFWTWLRERGHIAEDAPDPFAGLRFKSRRKEETRAKREGFTAAEVSALYSAALKREDGQLADFILLAAHTGARRGELANLTVEQVDLRGGWIKVEDAKTEAGNRMIPVHPKAAPVLLRLIGKRTSGFVFEGFVGDKYGARGSALGKRFMTIKRKLGHGPSRTFHSLRHSVSQALQAQDVSEALVADILGHKHATMTGGRYGSPAARRVLLPGALARLKYPRPL
jgi:integrase